MLGIPWDEVHEEAERIEHAMSPVLEERMFAAIGDAKTCPHGHPINAGSRIDGVPLADCEPGATIRILRFENEAEELLHYLHDAASSRGCEGRSWPRATTRSRSSSAARESTLTRSVAETVSVVADPSPPPRVALPEQLVHLPRTATGARSSLGDAAGRGVDQPVLAASTRPRRRSSASQTSA